MTDQPAFPETDDPDWAAIPAEEREKIVSLMQKMMELGICAVYGQEDDGASDAVVDCGANVGTCRSKCCTLHFALTKEEARKNFYRHDPSRPFFMARDEDGYCLHIDRATLRCAIWPDRPLRCRRYDCMAEG